MFYSLVIACMFNSHYENVLSKCQVQSIYWCSGCKCKNSATPSLSTDHGISITLEVTTLFYKAVQVSLMNVKVLETDVQGTKSEGI